MLQQTLKQLCEAYKNYKSGNYGYPKFKKKGNLESYKIQNNNNIYLSKNNKHIKLPKIDLVKIKYHRNLPKNCHIISVTISNLFM